MRRGCTPSFARNGQVSSTWWVIGTEILQLGQEGCTCQHDGRTPAVTSAAAACAHNGGMQWYGKFTGWWKAFSVFI
jgi:hypothetical protein